MLLSIVLCAILTVSLIFGCKSKKSKKELFDPSVTCNQPTVKSPKRQHDQPFVSSKSPPPKENVIARIEYDARSMDKSADSKKRLNNPRETMLKTDVTQGSGCMETDCNRSLREEPTQKTICSDEINDLNDDDTHEDAPSIKMKSGVPSFESEDREGHSSENVASANNAHHKKRRSSQTKTSHVRKKDAGTSNRKGTAALKRSKSKTHSVDLYKSKEKCIYSI